MEEIKFEPNAHKPEALGSFAKSVMINKSSNLDVAEHTQIDELDWLALRYVMVRKIIKLTPKLSEKQEQELKDIETKIRGDMTDEEWAFFKTIRLWTNMGTKSENTKWLDDIYLKESDFDIYGRTRVTCKIIKFKLDSPLACTTS